VPVKDPTLEAIPESNGNSILSIKDKLFVPVNPPHIKPCMEELHALELFLVPVKEPTFEVVPESKGNVILSIVE
jgi:hypothetical protein